MTKLIEICCKCGFVHRDDRHNKPYHKQKKMHYHWMPALGEYVFNEYTIHATICACCVNNGIVDWKEFNNQRLLTPKKYYLHNSYNASLPDKYLGVFDFLYYDHATNYKN